MRNDLHMMPPEAPLPMPEQDFHARFRDGHAPGPQPITGQRRWRLAAFAPAVAATVLLLWVMHDWFSDRGLTWVEALLLWLVGFNVFWLALTVGTVLLGLWSLARAGRRPQRPLPQGAVPPLKVALLLPVCDEQPWDVLGNAQSMLEDLRARGGRHDYAMFVLSDTRNPDTAAKEQDSLRALMALSPGLRIHYRRRTENTGRKAGNIADWVRRWGGDWDAMLVLDADSLMTGRAVARLADALAADPGAGLIQSFPHLIGAQTVFARMQQFANGVYGAVLAEGLARIGGHDGNYWGHNAILRTRAFATCAGLPPLRGLRGRRSEIMSHDFVEAGLLRRAGWGVRFLPRITGSYEETPATLIDHILRDRRWCHGNLQHLRLLGAQGFASMSRFHLLHGAVGYLMSPVWFALLVMWALIGRGGDASVLRYFNDTNPLFPDWPAMTETRALLVIVLVYAMLLTPKLLGLVALPLTGARVSDFGGPARLALSVLVELVLSVAYAPVLMVQQMVAVFRSLLGLQRGWKPQARDGGRYGLLDLVKCHALETVSGIVLLAGMLAGLVSLWLLPIALSLVLAVPLSALSGARIKAARWLGTREDLRPPAIAQAAQHYRAGLRQALEGGASVTAAE